MKPSLDQDFPFLSMILKKVISRYMSNHRSKTNLEVPLQSAYRQHHSTETTLLKVHNDVLRSLDNRKCVFIVLLDLSAAFDTFDHQTLQKMLAEIPLAISGEARKWPKSYKRQSPVHIHQRHTTQQQTAEMWRSTGLNPASRSVQRLYYAFKIAYRVPWHIFPWICWWYSTLCQL